MLRSGPTKESKGTTQVGFVNRNGQVVIRNTGEPGTDFGATVYQLGCSICGETYGANGGDILNASARMLAAWRDYRSRRADIELARCEDCVFVIVAI